MSEPLTRYTVALNGSAYLGMVRAEDGPYCLAAEVEVRLAKLQARLEFLTPFVKPCNCGGTPATGHNQYCSKTAWYHIHPDRPEMQKLALVEAERDTLQAKVDSYQKVATAAGEIAQAHLNTIAALRAEKDALIRKRDRLQHTSDSLGAQLRGAERRADAAEAQVADLTRQIVEARGDTARS